METPRQATLLRRVNLTLLSFYGIGTILGAGIYVLIGKVAGYAGMLTPLAFVVAAVLAGLSAFSYAELSTRYPKSASEAVYIYAGFSLRSLALVVGLMIVAVSVTSSATLVTGLLGYLGEFISVARSLAIIVTVVVLAAIVIWGISHSVWAASLLTVLEIFGLLLVIWVTRESWAAVPEKLPQMFLVTGLSEISGILLGAFIAFYAYIGFEDMVNIAEEVKQPQTTLPRGIIIALSVTASFYIVVAIVSVTSVDVTQLAQSDAPLAYIYMEQTGREATFISSIGVISILNGVLVQMVMASRVLYGMGRQQWLPAVLATVSPLTHTPIIAILIVATLILVLSLVVPLLSLAKLTSFITLIVFALMNLALWRIKSREGAGPTLNIPMLIPICGFVFSVLFLGYQVYELAK